MLSWFSVKRLSSSVHPICLLNLFLTYSIWGYQHVHKCLKALRWRCFYKIGSGMTKTYMTVTKVPIIISHIQTCNATPLMWEVLNYSTWIILTRKSHKPAKNMKKLKEKKHKLWQEKPTQCVMVAYAFGFLAWSLTVILLFCMPHKCNNTIALLM